MRPLAIQKTHASARRFYIYVLFDWLGIPRYIGKGTGDRWLRHEREAASINILKSCFIEKTWSMLGEIPKIKILENLLEEEAFSIEMAFIKAIGRYPNGPLCNMTDGGDGVPGLTPEQFSARARRANASRTPEERSAIARAREAAIPPEERNARRRMMWAKKSPEERRVNALKASLSIPPEQRIANGKKGQAKFTREERSARARAAQMPWTPEERSARARAGWARLSPEERSARIRRSRDASATSEERSARTRASWEKLTPEERSARALRSIASQTLEQLNDRARKGWETRRAKRQENRS